MQIRKYLQDADFMRRFFTKLSNGELLFLGLAFAIPGICLAVVIEKPSLLGKLLIALITETGFAFIIAWVIICTVDEREKKEHNRKVELDKRRLSSKLYLNTVLDLDLPASVTEELQTYVAGSTLMKEYQTVKMTLERCGDYCKLVQFFEVEFINVGQSPTSWKPTFDSYDNRVDEIESLNRNHEWGFNKVIVECRKSETESWTDVSPPDVSTLDKEAQIGLTEAIEIPPQGKVRVIIQQTCSKFASDNELFTNKSLTKALDLEVTYDTDKFEVLYRAIHPSENFDDMKRVGATDRIKFTHPFLPSHGFVVWWRPRDLSVESKHEKVSQSA